MGTPPKSLILISPNLINTMVALKTPTFRSPTCVTRQTKKFMSAVDNLLHESFHTMEGAPKSPDALSKLLGEVIERMENLRGQGVELLTKGHQFLYDFNGSN